MQGEPCGAKKAVDVPVCSGSTYGDEILIVSKRMKLHI